MPGPNNRDSKAQGSQFYAALLDQMHEGISFVDRDHRITYWSKGAMKLTGFAPEEASTRYCQHNFLCEFDEKGERLCTTRCPIGATIADGQPREGVLFLSHKAGHRAPMHVRVAPVFEGNSILGSMQIFTNDPQRRAARRSSQDMQRLAFLDPLTKVAGRPYMENRLQSAFREHAITEQPFGVLLFDIDRLKQINNQYGQSAGNEVLRLVAQKLNGLLRPDDILGRWDGGHFLAIIFQADLQALTAVAERCRRLIRNTGIASSQGMLQVTVSVAGTVAARSDTAISLLRRLDERSYAGKGQGSDRVNIK